MFAIVVIFVIYAWDKDEGIKTFQFFAFGKNRIHGMEWVNFPDGKIAFMEKNNSHSSLIFFQTVIRRHRKRYSIH